MSFLLQRTRRHVFSRWNSLTCLQNHWKFREMQQLHWLVILHTHCLSILTTNWMLPWINNYLDNGIIFHAKIKLEPGKYRHLICVKVKYYIIVLRFNHFSLTVKPVLRGHLWDKEKLWPYKTGVCIIDMTAWAGLTI